MSDILVSVIIPNYNHAKYLDERINSVLNQTCQNFEIIILDDCSSDNSKSVIEKYRSNPHVSHINYNEVNSGSTFEQWHKGFELAKGELIWIAESDDYCSNDMLDKLVNEFRSHPDTVISYSTSTRVDGEGKILMSPIKRKTQHFKGIYFIKNYLTQGNSIQNASSCVFLKSAALNISQDYTQYKGAGDRLFWIYIAEQGDVSVINQGLNFFRRHSTNSTSKYYTSGQNYKEDKFIFDYLKGKGYINYFRECQAKFFIQNSINHVNFDTEDIRQDVIDTWKISKLEFVVGTIYYYIISYCKKLCYLWQMSF